MTALIGQAFAVAAALPAPAMAQDTAAGCGDMPEPPACIEQAPIADNRNAEIECRDAMMRFGDEIRNRVTCLAAEQQRTSGLYQDALQRLNCRADGDC